MPLKYVKTQQEFDALLGSTHFLLVNFTAAWCGPCKMIAPEVEVMATENPSVTFVKLDIDENEDTPSKYNISAVPTFILFKNGEPVGEVTGANADKIRALVGRAH